MIPIKTALVSVSDKTGLADLATYFSKHNISMIATGGTAKFIRELGYPVKEVSEVTGCLLYTSNIIYILQPVLE